MRTRCMDWGGENQVDWGGDEPENDRAHFFSDKPMAGRAEQTH